MQREIERGTEHADPHELHHPIPHIVVGLVIGLIVWAIAYIYMARPNSAAALGDKRAPESLAQNAAAPTGPIDGHQLYSNTCQACHQATGQGLPGVFPPLAGSSSVQGDPKVLVRIVLRGLTGPIEVSGKTYNGAMPTFAAQLSDAEFAALLSFLRTEWGNKGAPVDQALVETARKATADRTEPWHGTEELLQSVNR